MHALIGFLQEPSEPFSSPLREWRLSSFVPNKRWFLQTALLYATAAVVVGIFGLLLPVWSRVLGALGGDLSPVQTVAAPLVLVVLVIHHLTAKALK
jgi:hypothetical protein